MKRRTGIVLGGIVLGAIALAALVPRRLPASVTLGGVRMTFLTSWTSVLSRAVASRDPGEIVRAFHAAIFTVGYPVHDPRTALPVPSPVRRSNSCSPWSGAPRAEAECGGEGKESNLGHYAIAKNEKCPTGAAFRRFVTPQSGALSGS